MRAGGAIFKLRKERSSVWSLIFLALIFGWALPAGAIIGGASPVNPERIGGSVIYEGPHKGKIIVEAHARSDFADAPVSSTVLEGPGEYELKVKTGFYYLRAFVDLNGNGVFDAGEPVGEYGSSNDKTQKAVVILPLGSKIGIDIKIPRSKQ